MSLFDVIKYGSMDIGDRDELGKLPIGIFNMYWGHLTGHADYQENKWTRDYQCWKLVEWNFFDPYESNKVFYKVLSEYDEPI